MLDAVQAAIDRIEAVGDVRKPQRIGLAQQAREDVGEHFIRAVADEHLVVGHTATLRERVRKLACMGVGVQAQPVVGGVTDRLQRAGRRAVRVFVGVELDQALNLRLFAGHIGLEVVNDRAPVAAHGFPSIDRIKGGKTRDRRSRCTGALSRPVADGIMVAYHPILNHERFAPPRHASV